jgi:glucose-1-phosphate thymidylyltransferase
MVKNTFKKIVGIIPAGGKATRVAPLPCSKEIYPIAFLRDKDGNIESPKVVIQFLLEKMKLAGASEVYIIISKGKWDIPDYLGNGNLFDMNIAYLIQGLPYGAPFTLDQAFPFVKKSTILLGFPDVLFEPEDVYLPLLKKIEETKADIVLGLFPTENPTKVDMVLFDDFGKIQEIVIKPKKTSLKYSWGIAAWQPSFSKFMHQYLGTYSENPPTKPEFYLGDVINAGIKNGLQVEGLKISKTPLLDIGTKEDLLKAVKSLLI